MAILLKLVTCTSEHFLQKASLESVDVLKLKKAFIIKPTIKFLEASLLKISRSHLRLSIRLILYNYVFSYIYSSGDRLNYDIRAKLKFLTVIKLLFAVKNFAQSE